MNIIQDKKLNLYEKILIFSLIVGSGLSLHKIYLYHILMGINLIFIIFLKKNYKINNCKFITENKVLLVFFLYSFFRIFFVKDYELALKNQIYIICSMSVFYMIKKLLIKNCYQVLKIIKKIFFFSCLIGFLEVFHIFRWFTSVYTLEVSSPSVFYGNTNNYAIVLVMVFPFVLFMKKSLKKLIMMLTIIYLLTKCDSRINNIAIMIEIFIYVMLNFYKSNVYKRAILLFSGFFFIGILKEKIIEKFYIIYELMTATAMRTDSIGIRKIIIINLLSELKKINIFLFGIGGGNSILIHKIKGNTYGVLSNHSFFLELLIEYGVFIFVLLGSYYLMLIFKNFEICIKTDNYINKSLFISLIGVTIGINSASGAIYFFPFWSLLGVADFYMNKELRDEQIRIKYNNTRV